MADATASARAEISRLQRAPEPEVLAPTLKAAKLSPESRRRVESRALAMLAELRSTPASGWVTPFLQEYRLDTSEGIPLLWPADAFPRMPDSESAAQRIAGKLGHAASRGNRGQ